MLPSSSDDGMNGGNVSMCVPLCSRGAAPVDAAFIFRRWNEWWNRVHVRGKNDGWLRMVRRGCVYVEAVALNRHLLCLITQAAKLAVKIISHRGFVAGDGFNIDELARKRDGVHAGENSRAEKADLGPALLLSTDN